MDSIRQLWRDITGAINLAGLIDVFDILLLAYIIYRGWKLMRETRASQLMKGILLLAAGYLIVKVLEMRTMTYLMENAFSIGLLALCVLFQPELRRALEKVGHTKVRHLGLLNIPDSDDAAKWERAINAIVDACEDLSATCTGALIVIEKQTRLGEQIDTGTLMNALPSRELFGNIFYTKTPLHDGAVIIRDGMILAAACFLPKPQKDELINKSLGSRHRAAIGMSENSDAIIVIVSEETGTISVAENGELNRGFNRESLRKYLSGKLLPEKPLANEKRLWFLGGKKQR